MLAQLLVVAGPDQGRAFPLQNGQKLLIGRGQKSGTQLNDPHASREHCWIDVDGGRFRLHDNGSAGGTFVNGQRVERHELQPGDVVRVGHTELRLELHLARDESTLVTGPTGSVPAAAAAPLAPATAPQPSAPPAAGTFHAAHGIVPLKNLVGTSVGHFKLEKILHTGNRGIVFLAHDGKQDRPAAVKVFWPELARQEEEVQRFLRAVKTMLHIKHENLVEVYAAAKIGPYCVVAMEYVPGEPLTRTIQRIGVDGMLDWRVAFRATVHVARALEEAHRHQIIHRNISPKNILLRSPDKVCKLGGLLLAKALEGTLAQAVTRPGEMVGDVAYMSPERTRPAEAVDCRADLYSLGATAYALLTGRPPLEADSLPELVSKIRQEEPIKPKQFQLSIADRFQDVVMRLLAKRPLDRYVDPTRLLVDLDRIARFENVPV